jgi:hypothetical protein
MTTKKSQRPTGWRSCLQKRQQSLSYIFKNDLDELYEDHQQKIDQVMRAKGYKEGRDWVTQEYKGHKHNEEYWRKRIDVPLMFLLTNDK